MRKARQFLFATAVLSTSLAAPPVQARHHRAASAEGRFDYYLLSLSIAPAFCSLSPRNGDKDECRSLTEAAFRQTPLTVHGLWPNRAGVSVNLQLHDCDGPPFQVSDQVQTDLRRYMPAGPGLERYEWRKHGACSGLPPETYFSTVVRLAGQANDTVGAAIRDGGMLGQTLYIADLLRAVSAKDQALAAAIVVDCKQPSGGGGAVVDEIRIVFSKDFAPMPATSVGLGQNSGCPAGAGRVPDVSQ